MNGPTGEFEPEVIGAAPYTGESLAEGSIDPKPRGRASKEDRRVSSLSGFVSRTVSGGVLISASAKNRADVGLGGASITLCPEEARRVAEQLIETADQIEERGER